MAKSNETAGPRDPAKEALKKAPEGSMDGLSAIEHVEAAMANIKANAEDGVLSVKEERILLKLDNVLRMVAQRE